jgi:hypothetical protein
MSSIPLCEKEARKVQNREPKKTRKEKCASGAAEMRF